MKRVSLTQTLRLSVFALGLASMAVVASAPNTFAATQTWTGTDCATDCNFSNTLNWQSGVVPVNGDDVIINSSAQVPTNDIANLSLASLTLNNNDLTLGANLVLTGSLVTAAGSGNAITATATGDLVLGGNVTVSSTGGSLLLDRITAGTLTLGTNTLTITGFTSPNEFTGTLPISGSGIVVYDSANIMIGATNSYSGTTTVTANGRPVVVDSSSDPFGSSTVNIAAGGEIGFSGGHSNLVLGNPINIAAYDEFSGSVLRFGLSSQTGSYTLNSVVMNSNVSFSTFGSATPTVNLAGITTNGFCALYEGIDAFSNGPEECELDAVGVGAPAAPNTALRMVSSNPLVVAVLGLLTVAALALVARKVAFNK